MKYFDSETVTLRDSFVEDVRIELTLTLTSVKFKEDRHFKSHTQPTIIQFEKTDSMGEVLR